MITRKQVIVGAIALAMGLFALVATQTVGQEQFDPIVEGCATVTPHTMVEFERHFHPFEGRLGGNLVCIVTQFVFQLVQQHPAGLLSWVTTISTSLPTIVLMVVEAGRSGARGPLTYPTVILVLGQILGISAVFPLVWIPSYCFGRRLISPVGTVSTIRARLAVLCLVPAVLGTILAFTLDPTTKYWTWTVGVLGGPFIAMIPIVTWNDQAPPEHDATLDMVSSVRTSYAISGGLSLVTWIVVVYQVIASYGFHPVALYDDLWGNNAHGFVKFMVIDAVVLYMGMLLYIAYASQSPSTTVLQTIQRTLWLGPGAACAWTLAAMEHQMSPLVATRPTETKQLLG